MDEGLSPSGNKQNHHASIWRKNENSWIIGISLLLGGTIFLVQNLTGWRIEKWWSILLIIPALASFVTAWRKYQKYRRTQRGAFLRLLATGLLLLMMVPVLLFSFQWQEILPTLFFPAGLVVLLGAFI